MVYQGVERPIPDLSATTATITVVPGLAANFILDVEPQPLPADERSITPLSLKIQDQWGNWIADGTPFSILLEGTGAIHGQTYPDRENFDGDSDGIIQKGTITKTIRAGMFAENQKVNVVVDGRILSLTNPNTPIIVEPLYSEICTTFPVAGDQPVNVPLVFRVQQIAGIDANGNPILQPVPDGTPVGWWAERGQIQPSISFTVNGFAYATLVLGKVTPSSNGSPSLTYFNEKPDEQLLVKASVPGNFSGAATIRFIPSAEQRLFAFLTQNQL